MVDVFHESLLQYLRCLRLRVHIQLVCHKLATTSCYRGHLAMVGHNIYLTTVHSWVTVGGCSMEYKYKPVHQYTTTVGGTRCHLWLKQSQSNLLQGHTKHFSSYLRIEQSSSSWKATGYSKNGYRVTSQTNYGELEISLFLELMSCLALKLCNVTLFIIFDDSYSFNNPQTPAQTGGLQ